jgi:hypothetical protein
VLELRLALLLWERVYPAIALPVPDLMWAVPTHLLVMLYVFFALVNLKLSIIINKDQM